MSDHPQLVTSEVSGVDQFSSKSHSKIACSLAEFICHDATKGKLIGLEGDWGSGKSNIIKLAELRLQKTHHVFVYDAWGHQEDLQRRSFLEELTLSCTENGLLPPKEWSPRLNDLLARTRTEDTEETPSYSSGVILSFLLTIALAFFAVVADVLQDNSLKIALISLPVVIGIFCYVIACIRQKKRLNFSDIFYIYDKKKIKKSSAVTISEKQPSSRQFREWIKDLSIHLKKELVIVFDNMDRLPSDRVRELWSSIHTFFAEEELENIRTIVPFDRHHLGKIFDKEQTIDEFTTKSFSIVFPVPPLVLTDWRDFFDRKLKEAFGKIEKIDHEVVRNTYDIYNSKITPRKVISHINDLVTYRRILPDEIKLKYICLYLCNRKKILESPTKQIIECSYLGNGHQLFDDRTELQNQIAAIVFNVPLESSSQVALSREIENALNNEGNTSILTLAKHNHFDSILLRVINNTPNLNVANSAIVLNILYETDFPDSHATTMQSCWEILATRYTTIQKNELAFTKAEKALLSHSTDSKTTQVANHIVRSLSMRESIDGANYYSSLQELKEFLVNKGSTTDINTALASRVESPENFINYLSKAKEHWSDFKVGYLREDLIEYLIPKIPHELGGLDCIGHLEDDVLKETLVEQCEAQFDSINPAPDAFGEFIQFYSSIKPTDLKIPDDRVLHQLLANSQDHDCWYDLAAMRLIRADAFRVGGNPVALPFQVIDEEDIIKIARRIEKYANLGTLIKLGLRWQDHTLISVIKNLFENNYCRSRLNIEDIIPHIVEINEIFSIPKETIIARLNLWHKFAKDKVDRTNICDLIDANLFDEDPEREYKLYEHLSDMAKQHLEEVGYETWNAALLDESSYYFTLTVGLIRNKRLTNLPDDLVSAYKDRLKAIARSEFVPSDIDKYDAIYDRINKNRLKATLKDIRDMWISEGSVSAQSFLLLHKKLLRHGDLEKRAGDVVRTIIFPIIEYGSCLKEILEHCDQYSSIINKAGHDAEDLKDTLRRLSRDDLEDEALKSFLDLINQ
jgi:hypothetical protein